MAVRHRGKNILILKQESRWLVFVNECPHRGLQLDESIITNGQLVCPHHNWQFKLPSGTCSTYSGYGLQPVPFRIQDGYLWVRAGD